MSEGVAIGCLTSQSTTFHLYMTANRCAGGLKKLNLQRVSHAIDISYGFLTYLSKHRHGENLLTVIPRSRPISVAFYDAHNDTEDS